MKKLLLIITSSLFFLISCKKEEPYPKETKTTVITNPIVNTSWKSPDIVANIIYGSGCTTTIEFLSETSCQEIKYRTSRGTDVYTGTYSYNGGNVKINISGRESFNATISGSVMITDISIYGDYITYTKQ